MLSAEWGRTFGKWRITSEEIDAAIELCKAEWGRVPENVTKSFLEMLNRAIAGLRKTPDVFSRSVKTDIDLQIEMGAVICKKIKAKHPEMQWMTDIPLMLNSLKISARQQNQKGSDIEILRLVERMV